jgi:ssRNA-specific RNase YbeY (16S rRNA maturation enzyme)
MKPNVEIALSSPLWRGLPDIEPLTERAIAVALATSGVAILDGAEISVQLTDDTQIRALNAQWRGVDKATNVLSFPASPSAKIATAPLLGDIVLAFETAKREAASGSPIIASTWSCTAYCTCWDSTTRTPARPNAWRRSKRLYWRSSGSPIPTR